MTFERDGENPPDVLSEVETCRCAPLNQSDMKSCCDGNSMIMYQVDYNKLYLSHPSPSDNILLELCYNMWT